MTFPFTRGGYRHVLLRRHEQWCLVERTWIEDGKPHLPHYEVIRLQNVPAKHFPQGHVTPPHEAYPSPRQWGREGWSEPTLGHALRRAERVCPEAGWHREAALLNTPTTWRPLHAPAPTDVTDRKSPPASRQGRQRVGGVGSSRG